MSPRLISVVDANQGVDEFTPLQGDDLRDFLNEE